MAIGDPYATDVIYKQIVGRADALEVQEINDDILAMSRAVDKRMGRYFSRDGAPTTRKYTPSLYARTCYVEDIATVTGLVVKVDDNRDGVCETTLTIETDFVLEPTNAAVQPEPQPYTQLVLPTWATSRGCWPGRVEVLATHGWPTIPKAIERWVCQLVAIFRLETPRALERTDETIDAVLDNSTVAQGILDLMMTGYGKPAWVYS